jgi:hypothetical protein
MTGRRWLVGTVIGVGSLAMAACSSSSSTTSTTSTTAPPSGSSTTAAGTSSTTTAASATATNLPVTNQIRTQLVAAASALQSIPVAQFSGLAPGLTYYGLDKTTGVRWAGARLVPAPVPEGADPSQAQISSQDEGSYYVFQQPSGGSWTAYPAGNTGPGTACPVTLPPAVLVVWGWPAGSCRPNGV